MQSTGRLHPSALFRIVTAIALLGLLLSACSPQKPMIPTATLSAIASATPELATATPTQMADALGVDLAELQGLQIHFMHPWMGSTRDELFRMVDEFNQNNEWGVFVIMDAAGSSGQLEQKAWLGLRNGDAVNVIAAPVNLLRALEEKSGAVADLNKYINSNPYAMTSEQVEDFDSSFWAGNQVDGKQLGIPAQETAAVLFYNSTWARELGFSAVPVTPEELQEQVCAANRSMREDKDTSNDGLGGLLVRYDAATMYAWLMSFNANPLRQGEFLFNSPEAATAFEFLVTLKNNSCAWSGKTAEPYEYFATRKALVYSGQMQDISSQFAATNRAGSKDDWQILPYPGVERPVTAVSGLSYGILSKDAASDLAAWLFLRWLSAPGNQSRLGVTFGTLPLGKQSGALLHASSALNPQWFNFIDSENEYFLEPSAADWIVVKPILEDAGWQLFNSGMKVEEIPLILKQMDDLAVELSERYP